ncbi:MAG TPA: squalene/phytoene synthase family protein, partial [Phycisphaeraceae bacterium]
MGRRDKEQALNSTGIEPSTLLQDHAPPAMTPRVRTSLVYCRQLTRRRAGNFYYGLMLTPEPKRSAVYAVYAFMRRCDDLADGPQAGAAEDVRARIETFRAQMEQVLAAGPDDPLPQDPIWPAFWYVARSYPLDRAHLHAMLDGQLCDLVQMRYACFDELEAYCYRVASVVGLVCLSIWGYQGGQATQELARERGIAFQLTNILRDLA